MENGTTHRQEVEAEEKSQPQVLLGFWRYKISTRTVGICFFDVKSNPAGNAGFRPIKLEEPIARERRCQQHPVGGRILLHR